MIIEGIVKNMKLLNRWYSLLCIFAIQADASIPSMSIDNFDNGSLSKKTHNAIISSVSNADSIDADDNTVVTSGEKKNIKSNNDVLVQVPSAQSKQVSNDATKNDGDFKKANPFSFLIISKINDGFTINFT